MTNNLKEKCQNDFATIYNMITDAKSRAWQQVNNTLITLYWNIGRYVSEKVEKNDWGKSIVEELSKYIVCKSPSIRGFSARNIWRMKQFYDTYVNSPKLSALLTEISWTNHLHIMSKTKSIQEKEYYLSLAADHHYSERALARLIDSCTYERTKLADLKLSAALTEFPVNTKGIFKDSYLFEFLGLPNRHKETDLRRALVLNLKTFLIEMGPDFTLIGEEYPLQVGIKDFRIDLLLFHRGLNCMTAIEIKTTEFEPSYLGQLQFYLEALDCDVKKPHENPSIGILICKTKDDEVVKYALNRSLSPTMVAEYETKLINKTLLKKKLQELDFELETENRLLLETE